jgi:hypothetical protein
MDNEATTADLLEASFKARNAGDFDEAQRLMQIAMRRPDADRAVYERFRMKPQAVHVLVDDADGIPHFVRIAE